MRVRLHYLVDGPILDLEDQEAHLTPEEDEIRLPALDVGQVPSGELVVGLGDRFQESIEAPLALGLELLDAPGIIVAMVAPYIARDAQPSVTRALRAAVRQEC